MREKRNAYEILGTNKIAVDRKRAFDKKEEGDKTKDEIQQQNEIKKDSFIREKKDEKIKKLSIKIEIIKKKIMMPGSDTEKKKLRVDLVDLEREIELVENAYRKISDKEHRDKYNAYLEMLDKMGEAEYGNLSEIAENQQRSKSRTAYEILGISQEKCDDTRRTTERIDRDLLEARDGLIEIAKARYEENLKAKRKNAFAAQQKLDLQIGIIQEAYEKIATKRKRERYNAELKEKERQEQKEIEQKQFERIYNKRNIYDPTSIVTLEHQEITEDNEGTNLLGVTMVKENGQKIFLQQVGKIKYGDSFGLQGEVGEYEITRVVGSRVKTDKVYITGLNMSELSIDENTGKLKDEAYYQFIANEMLSEESTEQCLKYNNGYLGELIYDENNGKYFRFLDGREDLSAVMKYYEEKNKGQGSLGENEGESYEQ